MCQLSIRSILLGLVVASLVMSDSTSIQADDLVPGFVEVVAEVEEGPGNITVLPDGRIVMSLHPFYAPKHRVVVLTEEGQLQPFPNARWSEGAEDRVALDAVLGIQADQDGTVWMLDNGLRSRVTPKLVAWDAKADRLRRVVYLPAPITREDSFVNDLAVDTERSAVYIADPAGGANAALIVVDQDTGNARRVLEGHASVVPEDVDLVIDGTPVEIRRDDGTTFRPHVGVNPIMLDATCSWLYYGPMHGTAIYRVKTTDLLDAELSAEALGKRVERWAEKPISDGSSMDDAGNIYISDVGGNAVGVIGTDRKYRILAQDDERLSWPDAFSFGPDGMLYTVANQLHRSARLHAGKDATKRPFLVLKIVPLARGTVGR